MKITNRGWLFVQGLLFGLLGIVMIVFPHVLTNILSMVIAVALFVVAVSAVWAYVQQKKQAGKNEWYLILGAVLAVALGVCLMIFDHLLFLLLTGAAGVWVLVQSIRVIAQAITNRSFGTKDWVWFVLVALLIILFTIIFMIGVDIIINSSIILMGVAALLIGVYCFYLFVHTGKKAIAGEQAQSE